MPSLIDCRLRRCRMSDTHLSRQANTFGSWHIVIHGRNHLRRLAILPTSISASTSSSTTRAAAKPLIREQAFDSTG